MERNLFYHTSSLQVFQPFQSLFLPVKVVNHCEFYVIFRDIENWLQENILITNFIIVFYKIFIKLRCFLPPIGKFCNIAHQEKFFVSQYLRYDDSIFILLWWVNLHVFVTSFFILMNSMEHSTSETFFYH